MKTMNRTNKLIMLLGLAVLLFALTACKSDGISLTSEDVYEAASYIGNHRDEYIDDKRINYIEEE